MVRAPGATQLAGMPFDLDLFDDDREDRRVRRRDGGTWRGDEWSDRDRHHHDDDDDGWRDRGRAPVPWQRRPERRPWWNRRAHPHVFSWLLLGGGVVILAIALLAVLSSLGLWGALADGYHAVAAAVLPATWHDEWQALPGLVHVALVLGALFVAAGLAGELLD